MRVLFASPSFLGDSTNGASVSLRDILVLLARAGTKVRAVCGDITGRGEAVTGDELASRFGEVARARLPYSSRPTELVRYEDAGFVTTVLSHPKGQTHQACREQVQAAVFDAEVVSFRPDVILTYGGCGAVRCLLERARLRGIPVIFRLAN